MRKMRNDHVMFLIAMISSMAACSTESFKRTGYETLQNMQEAQCQKDLSAECPERESYDAYQKKIKGSGNSEQ